jgi:hypothetical protein
VQASEILDCVLFGGRGGCGLVGINQIFEKRIASSLIF